MNERIRELAEQAMQQVCTERTIKGQIERTWDPARYDQVFAELIIRECAGISAQHNRIYYKSHGQIIADKIKEYFGVE